MEFITESDTYPVISLPIALVLVLYTSHVTVRLAVSDGNQVIANDNSAVVGEVPVAAPVVADLSVNAPAELNVKYPETPVPDKVVPDGPAAA